MTPRSLAAALVLALGLGGSPGAQAAPEPISGTLSRSGYTVVALGADGAARLRVVRGRAFSIRPPARVVTLHLRGPDGRYAGPVVVATRRGGARAVLGVEAGARLGRVRISGAGYAKVSRPSRAASASRVARARGGVPIGAGRFGLVRSRIAKGGPGDRDLDGIADPFDVDDDGDRILDNLDRHELARRAAAEPGFQMFPALGLWIDKTANANALGLTAAHSDAMLVENGQLIINRLSDSAELDCGGLGYCSAGGTGSMPAEGYTGPTDGAPEFPEAYDADDDGFGTLVPFAGGGSFLHPGATSAQIKTGDVLTQRVTAGGVEQAYPATLQYVFATVPALRSYSDTAGHAAAVRYPVFGPWPAGEHGPPPPDVAPSIGLGAHGNGFPVAPGAEDGHIRVTFELWRPQRLRTSADPGEGDWIDIGGLRYTLAYVAPDYTRFALACGQPEYATDDASLGAPAAPFATDDTGQPGGGYSDRAPDRPADPDNTLRFTVDLTACLASRAVAFGVGDELRIDLMALAATGSDQAAQTFYLKRVG